MEKKNEECERVRDSGSRVVHDKGLENGRGGHNGYIQWNLTNMYSRGPSEKVRIKRKFHFNSS